MDPILMFLAMAVAQVKKRQRLQTIMGFKNFCMPFPPDIYKVYGGCFW
jgi:hypothetical protein